MKQISEPEAALQPNQATRWDKDRTAYVVEIRMLYEDMERSRRRLPSNLPVWLVSEQHGKCFIGYAKNVRSAELKDGRNCIVVCDVNFDGPIWKEGWKGKDGLIRLWAEEGIEKLRVGDMELIGPVEEVVHAR